MSRHGKGEPHDSRPPPSTSLTSPAAMRDWSRHGRIPAPRAPHLSMATRALHRPPASMVPTLSRPDDMVTATSSILTRRQDLKEY